MIPLEYSLLKILPGRPNHAMTPPMPTSSRVVERKPARASTRVYYRYDRHGDIVEVSSAELHREPSENLKQGAFVLQGELRCLTGNRSG